MTRSGRLAWREHGTWRLSKRFQAVRSGELAGAAALGPSMVADKREPYRPCHGRVSRDRVATSKPVLSVDLMAPPP
jgi:hypothetical protein